MDSDHPTPPPSKPAAAPAQPAAAAAVAVNSQSPGQANKASDGPTDKAPTTRKEAVVTEALSFFKTLAIFFAAAFVIKASVVEAFKIPSLSMWPTLKVGDQILVSKFSYGFRLPLMTRTVYDYGVPRRGDIVVFTRPDDPSTNIIKRVVGLPGDTVEVKGMTVFINNQIHREPYARWERHGIPGGSFGPQRVPDNHIFLLGDNRDASKDSRFWDDPFLDLTLVKGRALLIYWSWEDLGRVGNILR